MRIVFLRVAAGEIDAGLDELAKAAPRGDLAALSHTVSGGLGRGAKVAALLAILESTPKWDLGRPVPR